MHVMSCIPIHSHKHTLLCHTSYYSASTESAAIRIGDDVLEVSSWGQYMLNSISNADLPAMVGPFTVEHTQMNENQHLFNIQIHEGQRIQIKTFKDWVSVKVDGADKKNFGNSKGLMGEFRTGRMLARDNSTILEDPIQFGNEWQVLESEPSLFQAYRDPQHPKQKCIMPEPKASTQRRLGESIAQEAAEAACTAHLNDEKLIDMCIYDVMASGDLEMAQAGAF